MVKLAREGETFAVAFHSEGIIVFASDDPGKLRRMCAFLRWKIIGDVALDDDEPR
jgi:hypothetical protein